MSRGRMRRPGAYETNETSRVALPFFRSKRLLSLHKYKMQHSHTRGKTNLGGEGETEVEVVQGVEVVLVDTIIPHVIAHRLELARG
jgi:hypothetical protein